MGLIPGFEFKNLKEAIEVYLSNQEFVDSRPDLKWYFNIEVNVLSYKESNFPHWNEEVTDINNV